jgi:probable phosphoglycerate mutase
VTELILVRHALPVGGLADPGLSQEGVAQARALADGLARAGVDALVTSPLRRARETADILAERLALTPVVVADLREWARIDPPAAYRVIEAVAADDPQALALAQGRYDEFVPEIDVPGFRARVVSAFDEVFARFPTGRVVVATHGGTINAFLAQVIGLPRVFWFNPGYASTSRVERLASGRTVVRSVNETGWLQVLPV